MENKIPKIIHYCWFGGKPLPQLALQCIKSWKLYFPDYEIKEWNESNFNINIVPYTSQAYKMGKYAFVSDYARFWILYNYGGIYFDTDVEVIKSMDDIIERGPFMGCENWANSMVKTLEVAPGLGLGVNPGLGLYKELLDIYGGMDFKLAGLKEKQMTIVQITTEMMRAKGLKDINEIQEIDGVYIYPKDFFCPIDYVSGKCEITSNTRSIHHYAATWIGRKQKLYFFISRNLDPKFAMLCSKIYKFIFS